MGFQCHNPLNALCGRPFCFQFDVQRGSKTLKLNNPFRTESLRGERDTTIVSCQCFRKPILNILALPSCRNARTVPRVVLKRKQVICSQRSQLVSQFERKRTMLIENKAESKWDIHEML